MILGMQDSGRTITLKVGDTISVRLKENATTGYGWQVDSSQGLERIGDVVEPGGAIGGSGFRVFQFRCQTPGTLELRLKNCRSWEGDSSITERFDVNLISEN